MDISTEQIKQDGFTIIRFKNLTALSELQTLFKKHFQKSPTDWHLSKASQDEHVLKVKELTLLGFFTSEPGATQVLQYEAVPGAYHGCVPLAEVGRTWATS